MQSKAEWTPWSGERKRVEQRECVTFRVEKDKVGMLRDRGLKRTDVIT